MDRDRRWERTKKAWDAIVLGRGDILDGFAGRGRARAV